VCCLLGTCHLNICKCEVRGLSERLAEGGYQVESSWGLYMDVGVRVT